MKSPREYADLEVYSTLLGLRTTQSTSGILRMQQQSRVADLLHSGATGC